MMTIRQHAFWINIILCKKRCNNYNKWDAKKKKKVVEELPPATKVSILLVLKRY